MLTDGAHSGFYDWVKVFQEYPFDLPRKASRIIRHFDGATDELLAETAPAFMAEGSFCTSMRIHVCGRKITVDGNPSRINRLDNVFGLATLDDCMRVINSILLELGLPAMTKCTKLDRLQNGDVVADGAVFQRLDLTNNALVGKGNERAFIRALSSQRFRHSIGYVYPDMNTAVWTPKGGEKAGRLVYPGVYNKGAEISAHLLSKVKRTFGEDSDEHQYVVALRDWCTSVGMVRFEIKLRSEYLKRERFCFWGLFLETELWGIHCEFLKVGDKMSLQAYDVVSITQELISKGICKSVQAAGRTAGYAYEWMSGATFDFEKSQVQEHRARLRRIGIDIKLPHDSTRHGVVFIHNVREVDMTLDVRQPSFYRAAKLPRHLQLVA